MYYDESSDSVICYVCLEAYHKKLLTNDCIKKDAFFVGFRSWKRTPEHYKIHQKSQQHCKSIELLVNVESVPIISQINTRVKTRSRSWFKKPGSQLKIPDPNPA